MARSRKPSPQTAAILLALADEPIRWSYGYDLCRSLGLKAGTVYPILIRLAERGHVDTNWEQDAPHGRPPRHLYRLSAQGAELASEVRRAQPATTTAGARLARPALGGAQ